MNSKSKLLIINKGQLGYLVDALKWCEYLRNDYSIIFIGIDNKRPKVKLDGVKQILSPSWGPRLIRGIVFTLTCILSIIWFKGKIIVVYYPTCSILKRIFPYRKMLLDIRTLSISRDKIYNQKYNKKLFKTCNCYDYVSVISPGIAKQIGRKDIHILPLGADEISITTKKITNCLNLIYVGTLDGRDIDKTISGIADFHILHPEVPIKYTIIGDGCQEETKQLINLVAENDLASIVSFIGRVSHHELSFYFDNSNIGVSFIPITDYYQNQPPTKTYEYIMSGLFCIATGTKSNKIIINQDNGVLINDNAEDFADALWLIWQKKSSITDSAIRNSLKNCNWEYIVKNHLIPILNLL